MIKKRLRNSLIWLAILASQGFVIGNEEKAIRPDAPELGSSLFGPDMACVSTPGCCSDATRTGCAPTVISETGVPQTLIASGLYCLATDLTNPLTILGSSISLDMNGHTIFVPADVNGITIANDNVDVRVFSGLINGQGAGGNNGIFVSDATDVRVENVTCVDCDYGIYLAGAGSSSGGINSSPVNTILNYVSCRENAFAGLFCQGDFNTAVNDSVFSENGIGILSDESESLVISRCIMSFNDGTAGLEISGSLTTEIRNCVANNNIEVGFLVSGSLVTILRDCDASDNGGIGFSITNNSTDASLFDCSAQANIDDGFAVEDNSSALIVDCKAMGNVGDGFFLGAPSSVVVRNSDATNNIGFGFNNAVPSNQFYSNVACGNLAGNYNGVISAPVASPVAADGYENVDCSGSGTVSGCEATPIFNTGATQTLTLSGRYCLAEDITAADITSVLIIATSSVFVDLNGHTINAPLGGVGVVVNAGVVDVRIYNGFINGNGVGLGGISVAAASDIRIEDVTAESFTGSGINIIGSLRATVNRVNINNAFNGVNSSGSDGTVINDSRFSNNVNHGLFFNNSSVNAVARGCIADLNVNGFVVAGNSRAELFNCTAETNTAIGFLVNTATALIDHCVAQFNTSHGFDMQALSVAMVQDSTATNNGGRGFNNAVVANQFYRNAACNNAAPNYNGVTFAPVAGPITADGVDNVDCADTALVSGCEATPIFNTGVTQTLTASGRYCLAEDITAAAGTDVLVINGNSISVDLNGHTITVIGGGGNGIVVNAGFTDVRIYNGFINGGGVGLGGIAVAAALDTRIEDVTCDGFTNSAITLSASLRTILNRVSANNSVVGLVCAGDNGTVASNCRFSNNSFTGVLFTTASVNGIMQSCKADLNAQGFVVGFGSNAELFNCTAESNTGIGFVVNSANALIDSCVAQYNTSHGFDMQAASVAMVQDSTATNNGGRGFNNAIAANQFYRNSACNNAAPNYNGVTFAPVAGPITADGVDNVDCNDTSTASGCEATPIFNTGATQTLTLPGRYCLAENITAAAGTNVLVINGDSISVDLNGHAIIVPAAIANVGGIGIFVNATASDVRIYNGSIDGTTVGANGIAINGASDVRIEDVTIANLTVFGIRLLTGTLRTLINRVDVHNTTAAGIGAVSDQFTQIVDTIVTNSGQNGIGLTGSIDTVLNGCITNFNTLDGVNVQGATSGLQILNCVSESNSNDGFQVGGTGSVVSDSIAQFNAGNGFIINGTNIIVKDCTATNNGARGFNNTVAANQFYRNFACNNVAPNYSGVTFSAVAGPLNADGVNNVDCSDTSLASGCEATPIFNTGATQTLAAPGRYCLAENITAAAGTNVLEITANSVFVDLNGHIITVPTGVPPAGGVGIRVNAGVSNAHIYNGLIDGGGTGVRGILVSAGASDTRIENLTCSNLTNSGIGLNTSLRTLISNVIVHNTGGAFGIECLSDSQTRIINSAVTNGTGSGIGFGTSLDAFVSGCSTNANAGSGVVVQGATSGVEVINCVAQHNTQRGFFMSDPVVMENCTAQYNTGNGFEINSAGNSIINECIASNNTGFGFVSANINNQFYKNEACNNTAGSYSGVVYSAVAGPLTADGVNNVDCNDTSLVAGCAAIPLYNTNGLQILSVSGRYCLAEDITAPAAVPIIAITGQSIYLDLNGHVITALAGSTAIDVSSNAVDIHISNGLIQGVLDNPALIYVHDGSLDVTIEDISLTKGGTSGVSASDDAAIAVEDATLVIIRRADLYNNIHSIRCTNSEKVAIFDSYINTADSFFGVDFDGCLNTLMRNCVISGTVANGPAYNVRMLDSLSTSIIDCITTYSDNDGFWVDAGCEGTELINCIADHNGNDGFLILSPTILTGCVAQYNNGTGFLVDVNSAISIISNCIAKSNGNGGFDNAAPTNRFYTNIAADNVAGDFNGLQVTMTPAVAATAGYWQNVNTAL